MCIDGGSAQTRRAVHGGTFHLPEPHLAYGKTRRPQDHLDDRMQAHDPRSRRRAPPDVRDDRREVEVRGHRGGADERAALLRLRASEGILLRDQLPHKPCEARSAKQAGGPGRTRTSNQTVMSASNEGGPGDRFC